MVISATRGPAGQIRDAAVGTGAPLALSARENYALPAGASVLGRSAAWTTSTALWQMRTSGRSWTKWQTLSVSSGPTA